MRPSADPLSRAAAASPRSSVAFRKLHGLGNDYLFATSEQVAGRSLPALARALSDRHFGVGADGLIVVGPPPAGSGAELSMSMFNADGSPSQMCGNGVRGLVRFAIEEGLAAGPRVRVASGGAVVTATARRDGERFEVEVDMGPPRFACGSLPMRFPGFEPSQECLGEPIARLAAAIGRSDLATALGEGCRFSAVSMGNPHLVLECAAPRRVAIESIGPLLERATCFPEGVNVHAVAAEAPDRIVMRTWERGSGITLACGSGACAAFAALRRLGRVASAAEVVLPGGVLRIAEASGGGGILMTGEAEAVFEGRVDPEPLLRRLGQARRSHAGGG